MNSRDIRAHRATLANEANAILTAVTGEARSLSAEDQQKFDTLHAEIDRLGTQAEAIEKHERVMAGLGESRGVIAGRQDSGSERASGEPTHADQVRSAFNAYMRYGVEGLSVEQRTIMSQRFSRDVESRTAQTVTTSGGGYIIPTGFAATLEESMKAYGNVEAVADIITTESGGTLPWPTVNDNANSGRLLAINTAATETAIAFGVTNFAAYKFSSDMVTVPVELLQDSAFDLESKLGEWLGTRLGRIHNQYQTTGTGSSEPGGIVAGGSSGVTAAATTTVTYDELLDLEHSIDPAYRSKAFGAGWMFNDGTFKKLRQLKDGDGKPLWQAGLAGTAPDTINGYPYMVNQDMAAMTTGLKPILFGAFKKFKIRKVKDITLLRLTERYAELHQVAFLAFTRFDSKVLDAGTDPIKYITMA